MYSSSKLRTAQMMIFSLVAMIGLEKCCITSACLQWLCHSGERTVACGPLVLCLCFFPFDVSDGRCGIIVLIPDHCLPFYFGSYDHWMIVYPVYVFFCPVTILFGCHGNIKF